MLICYASIQQMVYNFNIREKKGKLIELTLQFWRQYIIFVYLYLYIVIFLWMKCIFLTNLSDHIFGEKKIKNLKNVRSKFD